MIVRTMAMGVALTGALCVAAMAGCALIAGVQDGVLATGGSGGAATTTSTSSSTGSNATSGTTAATGTSTSTSTSGGGQVTRVNAIHGGDVMVSTATTHANVQTGDLLVVGVFWDQTIASVMSVGDSLGNTWQQGIQQTHLKSPCTSSTMVQLFYAENVHGGSDTVSVSLNNQGEDLDFFLLEYSGVATVAALDTQSGQTGMSSATTMSVSLQTHSPDLVVALFADTNGGAITAGAGYAALSENPGFSAIVEDNLQGTSGPGAAPGMLTPAATLGTGDSCWAAAAMAFKVAP